MTAERLLAPLFCMGPVGKQTLTVLFIFCLCLPVIGWGLSHRLAISAEDVTAESVEQPISEIETPLSESALAQQWVVNGPEAIALINQGATLLDARGNGLSNGLGRRRLEGAIAVNWRDFSPTEATTRGNLLQDDAILTEKLQTLGISANTPVVVFANPPKDWGEDGRIVWMLRTLGHRQAVIVDGGYQALIQAGANRQTNRQPELTPGDFTVNRVSTWTIQQQELAQQLTANNAAIIDTREPREFLGATPYGETRAGHIPGASHLYFKDFLKDNGTLISNDEIIEKLSEQGITTNTQIVVYCTGGIRSAWLATVLVPLGFQVRNYAGSMWEWSSGAASSYPLETQ